METEKVKDPETINNKQDEDCLGKENVEKKQNEKKKTEDIEEKHIQSVKEILNDIESKEDNRNIIIQLTQIEARIYEVPLFDKD